MKDNIRVSTKFLGIQLFSFFINPTKWDSIGFAFPLWIIYIFLCEYEKNKGRKKLTVHFYDSTIKERFSLLVWLGINIVTVMLHINESGALKLAFYYMVGGIFFIEFIDMHLTKKEIEWIIEMYITMAVMAAILLFIQRAPVKTYTNRLSVSIFGYVKDPNYFSAYLLFPCLICIYRLLYEKNKQDGIKGGLIAIAIFLTGSRSSFLALCISVIILCFPALKYKKRILKIIFFGIIAIIIIAFLLPENLASRFLNFESYNDGSNRLRSNVWTAAIAIWKSHFLFGAGQNVVYNQGINYGAYIQMMTHSTFFDILAEFGIIGFVFFIATPINIFKEAIIKKQILVIAGMVGLMSTSMIISAQYSQYYWFNLGLMSYIALSLKNK